MRLSVDFVETLYSLVMPVLAFAVGVFINAVLPRTER